MEKSINLSKFLYFRKWKPKCNKITDFISSSHYYCFQSLNNSQPIWLGCRMHQLHLCNKRPVYDIEQSDGEVPMLGLWGKQSTPWLPLLPGPLWPEMVAPDIVQVELFWHLNWTWTND